MEVAFRRLADADLPMLHRWLNEPGVVRWWEGDDVSWDGVVRDYAANPEEVAEFWIGTLDGTDLGWIQCYPMTDSPDEAAQWRPLGVDATAAGIDYLVGEPGDRGRGVGTAMIRAFAHDVVFGLHPNWTQAVAAPLEANTASWRALERAGFRFLGPVTDPFGPARLMALDRPMS